MISHEQEKHNGSIKSTQTIIVAIIGGAAATIALLQLAGWEGVSWILMIGGLTLLALVARRLWHYHSLDSAFQRWISQYDLSARYAFLGGILFIIGILVRFSPSDIGIGLSVIGIMLLAGGVLVIWLLPYIHRTYKASIPMQLDQMNTSRETPLPLAEGFSRLSEDFRRQISAAVFHHAQRASWMSFVVGITFFIVGISVFLLVAYSAYQLFFVPSDNKRESALAQMAAYLLTTFQSGKNQSIIATLSQVFPMLLLSLGQFVPVLALILIGWIGSKFIVDATRISQRRVIQDMLAELGPLQSTLAGIPPRKPMMQVSEQSLRQASRSFAVRTWLSAVLFFVGVVLFIALIIYGFQNGFQDILTTATVGGVGVISFIFSIVGNNQEEHRKALEEITRLEMEVAHKAQQAEIIDLFVAQLIRTGVGKEDIKRMEDFLILVLKTQRGNEQQVDLLNGKVAVTDNAGS